MCVSWSSWGRLSASNLTPCGLDKTLPSILIPVEAQYMNRAQPITASLHHDHCDWFRNGHMTQARPMRLTSSKFVRTIGKEILFPLPTSITEKMWAGSILLPKAESLPENRAKQRKTREGKKQTESWQYSLSSWYTMYKMSGSPGSCDSMNHSSPFCLNLSWGFNELQPQGAWPIQSV